MQTDSERLRKNLERHFMWMCLGLFAALLGILATIIGGAIAVFRLISDAMQ